MQAATGQSAAYSSYDYRYAKESNFNYRSDTKQGQTLQAVQTQQSSQLYSQAGNQQSVTQSLAASSRLTAQQASQASESRLESNVTSDTRFNGASDNRFSGASDTRFNGASDTRFNGASDTRFNGASDTRFNGASDTRFNGASDNRFSGASDTRYNGPSDNRFSGPSDNRFSGASDTRFNGASEEVNQSRINQSSDGDFFATYGTKKERRTVQKDSNLDESKKKNDNAASQQSRRQDDSQVAAVMSLADSKEASRDLESRGLDKKREDHYARAKSNEERIVQARQAKSKKELAVSNRKNIDSRKKQARQSELGQNKRKDPPPPPSLPPPLPPKTSPFRKQNEARLNAIERRLPELQIALRMLQQEKSNNAESQTSVPFISAPVEASKRLPVAATSTVNYKTQSTATDPKPTVLCSNAHVGTEEKLTQHRNQSTETSDFRLGVLDSVAASNEPSESKLKDAKSRTEVLSENSYAARPSSPSYSPDISDEEVASKTKPNLAPVSKVKSTEHSSFHKPQASPESTEESEVEDEVKPNYQKTVHALASARFKPENSKSNDSESEIDESVSYKSHSDLEAPPIQSYPFDSEDSSPEIIEDLRPHKRKDVEAINSGELHSDSEESLPEIYEDLAPQMGTNVQAPNILHESADSEKYNSEIGKGVTPNAHQNVEAPDSHRNSTVSMVPDDSDVNEGLAPSTQKTVETPCAKRVDSCLAIIVSRRDFSQHVFSDRDTVLEEFITPDYVPNVLQPNRRPEKSEKFPPSEVNLPALLDDPLITENVRKEHERPINETIEKSTCRVVELEPSFRWMFGDKCEQTDSIFRPLVDSKFSTKSEDALKGIDACTDAQGDLLSSSLSASGASTMSTVTNTDTTGIISKTNSLANKLAFSSSQRESNLTTEILEYSEKQQYLSEISRLKTIVSELEKRVFVMETVRIQESQTASYSAVNRRTVGLMVKPLCRDVAINIFIEDAKPTQRSVGVNVSFREDSNQSQAAACTMRAPELLGNREIESGGLQRTDSSSSSAASLVSIQRVNYFHSLRQTYGITAAEMINIITELLKRDVKSVGLQVCMDSLPGFHGNNSFKTESDDLIKMPTTSDGLSLHRTFDSTNSVVLHSRHLGEKWDDASQSTSDSCVEPTLSTYQASQSPESSTESTIDFSYASARSDSGMQCQEESSNQDFQYTSGDGTVTTSRTVFSSRRIVQQGLPESSATASVAMHTATFQQEVSNSSDQSTAELAYSWHANPMDVRPDRRILDFGSSNSESGALQSMSSFKSQSTNQLAGGTVSLTTRSESRQQQQRLVSAKSRDWISSDSASQLADWN